jgi:hypothetical protein
MEQSFAIGSSLKEKKPPEMPDFIQKHHKEDAVSQWQVSYGIA